MTDHTSAVTLLPWLNRGESRISLEIPMCDHGLTKGGPPRPLVRATTSMTRLLEGRFVTPAGTVLKKVLLLTESDRYVIPTQSLVVSGNEEIDRSWDRVLSELSSSEALINLEKHFDGKVFLPLFYCDFQRVYFHPWCHACGKSLSQCQHDELLTGVGLPTYSSSLRRFLYCRSCFENSGQGIFYTLVREDGDPPWVLDHSALLLSFGQKQESFTAGSGAPCLDCPQHENCFGDQNLVTARLCALSFYNFHLAIFPMPQFTARQFLMMVAGASFAEISGQNQDLMVSNVISVEWDDGRQIRLFANSTKSFEETLYIKTAFLQQVTLQLLAGRRDWPLPEVPLNLDQFWVETAPATGVLPFIWNFKVHPLGLYMVPGTRALTSLNAWFFYELARLWTEVLLVSWQGDVPGVFGRIVNSNDYLDFEKKTFTDVGLGLFPAEGNCRSILETPLGEKDLSLWREALGFVGNLYCQGVCFTREWSVTEFLSSLGGYADRLRTSLFEEGDSNSRVLSRQEPVQNEQLKDVLTTILHKWEESQPAVNYHPPGLPGLDETVILAGRIEELPTASLPSAPAEVLDETMILGLGVIQSMSPPLPVPLSSEKQPAVPVAKIKVPVEDETLLSTVMLSPEDVKKLREGKP